jgi:hypothetical protein
MAFINVSAVRTADPGNVWVPETYFMAGDPFAVVLDVQADSSLVSEGLLYDVVWQLVNPRQDPYSHAWWTFDGSNVDAMSTIDIDWTGVRFLWTSFVVWYWWSHYSDAVSQVQGPDHASGVFFVQGTINVQGSDLFAASGQAWYKVRP